MNANQRNDYLEAMQIDTWIPRVNLPYAAQSNLIATQEVATIPSIADSPPPTHPEENLSERITPEETPKIIATNHSLIEEKAEPSIIGASPPKFSLQLMKAGSCLLLIELTQGEALQIHDKRYQLLRNILKAAHLPNSPEWLGDIIHWPLFKQTSIAQGKQEANEFLQSFIKTYQEQLTDTQYLWLIGNNAIEYAAQLDESHYYQALSHQSLGQVLIIPSLDSLLSNPNQKAKLWQCIAPLISTW